MVRVAISDEGIGIPAKDLERIFERFYRVDPGRARETGGTGLGLSIVRHVAQNHGGNVLVDSREGEGSTFTLELPDAQRRDPDRGAPDPRPASSRTRSPSSTRCAWASSARASTSPWRATAARPWRSFTNNTFDVVLLDLMLPKVSGLDVCRQIRSRSDVPIIVVSAKGEEVDMVLLLELGADDYVTKPYRLRELVARIRAVLRRREGHEQPVDDEHLEQGGVRLDVESRRCYVDDARGQAAQEGVRAAAPPAREPRAGADPRGPHRPGVGQRLRRATPRPSTCTSSACAPLIEDDPKAPEHITTVRGVGYRFELAGARRPSRVRPPDDTGPARPGSSTGPVGATVASRRSPPRSAPSRAPSR